MLRTREGHSRWRWRRLQASLPLGAINPGGSATSAPTTTWRGRAHDASPGHACKPSSIRPAHEDYKYIVQLTCHQAFSVCSQSAGRLETLQQLLLRSTGSLAYTMPASSMHACIKARGRLHTICSDQTRLDCHGDTFSLDLMLHPCREGWQAAVTWGPRWRRHHGATVPAASVCGRRPA